MRRDLYGVLGLHPSSEDVVIRAAYRVLASYFILTKEPETTELPRRACKKSMRRMPSSRMQSAAASMTGFIGALAPWMSQVLALKLSAGSTRYPPRVTLPIYAIGQN